MRHNLHPSYNARSSSVPLSHHNFTDYPVQNNPETVLRISLHPACEDLHIQPLLPNGAVFQLFRWKISGTLLNRKITAQWGGDGGCRVGEVPGSRYEGFKLQYM